MNCRVNDATHAPHLQPQSGLKRGRVEAKKGVHNAPIHFAWYNAELVHHDIDPPRVDCFENIP